MTTRTCAALLLAATALLAKQDLTGSWSMVADKSDFGQLPAPTSIERVIDHKDPEISVKTTQAGAQGEVKTDYHYTTDGKEFTQTTRFGELKGTANWEGEELVVKTKRQLQGGEISTVERWKLNDGGKALVVNSQITTPQGEFKYTIHFEKK